MPLEQYFMKMRIRLLTATLVLAGGAWQFCHGQESLPKVKIKEYTVMEHYAPDLVVPAEERRRLKVTRQLTVLRREKIIDTLTIPERKKKKLRKELYRTPFSDKFDKVLSSLEPEGPGREEVD